MSVIPRNRPPQLLAGSLAVGLAAANVLRATGVAALLGRCGCRFARLRRGGVSAGRRAGGWRSPSPVGGGAAHASTRSIAACSRSKLDTSERARLVITGPSQTGRYDVRAPAVVTRFGALRLHEPVLLEASSRPCASPGRHHRDDRRADGPARARRTASTSERGCGATASTSCCAPAAGELVGRRGGLGGCRGCGAWAAARLGGPRAHRVARRGRRGRRPRRRRGSLGRLASALSRGRALPPARRVRAERRGCRRWRARACLARGRSAASRRARARSLRSARTSSPSVPSRQSSAPASPERSARSRGSRPAPRIAGISCSSARSCCSPGIRTRCSTRASSSRSPPWSRSSCSCRVSRASSRATRSATSCGWSSPFPPPAVWRPRRSPGSSSIRCSCSTVPANALAAPVVAPLLALALGAAALAPFSGGAAALLAWLNGWCAAYLVIVARLIGGLPFAQIRSTRSLLLVMASALLLAAYASPRWPRRSSPST